MTTETNVEKPKYKALACAFGAVAGLSAVVAALDVNAGQAVEAAGFVLIGSAFAIAAKGCWDGALSRKLGIARLGAYGAGFSLLAVAGINADKPGAALLNGTIAATMLFLGAVELARKPS